MRGDVVERLIVENTIRAKCKRSNRPKGMMALWIHNARAMIHGRATL
jgi:hypothetical protein